MLTHADKSPPNQDSAHNERHSTTVQTSSNTSATSEYRKGTRRFAGTGNRDPQEVAIREELLDQFYATLEVMYLAAEPSPKPASDSMEKNTNTTETNTQTVKQHERIRALLDDSERSWGGAYEIEQLLAFVMTDEQVAIELGRRIAEAKALKLKYSSELEARYNTTRLIIDGNDTKNKQREQSLTSMRFILQRLLNDLQWFYKQRIRRYEAAKRLSARVSALFLSAFTIFFFLLFIQYFSNPPGSGRNNDRENKNKIVTVPNTLHKPPSDKIKEKP